LKSIKTHELEQRHGPSSHELSHIYERDILDTGKSIEINHVCHARVAFVDHVIGQSSSNALANYEA